jgi:sulfite reductase beta subunit-like hemoprotein
MIVHREPSGAAGERRFASARDVDEFVEVLERFERGEIDAEKFREFRLTRGVYGQRQAERHMMRIKIPQGILSAGQLRVAARIAREKSRGFGHVTTRQNLQFHMVRLEDTEEVMREFLAVGVTTREACGNTVRNVTACALAGVCAGERFDVSAVAEALTRFLLRHPEAQNLPRKFKIAFSGCGDDCAFGAIHDLGFLARIGPGGEPGFRVVAGGGLATHPTAATEIEEFLPAELATRCALAIVRLQQRLGERKNRGRARLKYVVKRLGPEKFLEEYRAECAKVTERDAPRLRVTGKGDGVAPPASARPQAGVAPGPFEIWTAGNVVEQRQEGYAAVKVRLPLGDVTADQFEGIADLAEDAGDGTVRLSIDQNIYLRWVSVDRVKEVWRRLERIGLAGAGAGTIDDPTSCPGADTCNLAITHSRRLAGRLGSTLPSWKSDATRSTTVKISGCPNSCGQHHIATIGFHGSTARAAGRVIPVYQLHLGGGVDGGGVVFGRVLDKIPVHRVNDAIDRLMGAWEVERTAGETPLAYFRKLTKERVTEILGDAVDLGVGRLASEDLEDLGTGVPFRVTVGRGECAS